MVQIGYFLFFFFFFFISQPELLGFSFLYKRAFSNKVCDLNLLKKKKKKKIKIKQSGNLNPPPCYYTLYFPYGEILSHEACNAMRVNCRMVVVIVFFSFFTKAKGLLERGANKIKCQQIKCPCNTGAKQIRSM